MCVLQVKCAQYWPQREEREADFEDTNFRLTLISEDVKSYYTVRELELENLLVRHFISSHPVMLLLICQSLSLIILLFSTEILCSASSVIFLPFGQILVSRQKMLNAMFFIAGRLVDLT